MQGGCELTVHEWKAVPDIWRTIVEKYADRVALVDPCHDPPSELTYKQVSSEGVIYQILAFGRRSKARLHMALALFSCMVFGLLPPVLYQLSFRESNGMGNKMMDIASALLAYISLLALGKVHFHKRPRTYFKTLMLLRV